MTNWVGFVIAFVILDIIPVWVIRIMEIPFFSRVLLTIFLAVIIYIAMQYGGTKRGFITK